VLLGTSIFSPFLELVLGSIGGHASLQFNLGRSLSLCEMGRVKLRSCPAFEDFHFTFASPHTLTHTQITSRVSFAL